MRELTIKEQMDLNGGRSCWVVIDITANLEWDFNDYSRAFQRYQIQNAKQHAVSLTLEEY